MEGIRKIPGQKMDTERFIELLKPDGKGFCRFLQGSAHKEKMIKGIMVTLVRYPDIFNYEIVTMAEGEEAYSTVYKGPWKSEGIGFALETLLSDDGFSLNDFKWMKRTLGKDQGTHRCNHCRVLLYEKYLEKEPWRKCPICECKILHAVDEKEWRWICVARKGFHLPWREEQLKLKKNLQGMSEGNRAYACKGCEESFLRSELNGGKKACLKDLRCPKCGNQGEFRYLKEPRTKDYRCPGCGNREFRKEQLRIFKMTICGTSPECKGCPHYQSPEQRAINEMIFLGFGKKGIEKWIDPRGNLWIVDRLAEKKDDILQEMGLKERPTYDYKREIEDSPYVKVIPTHEVTSAQLSSVEVSYRNDAVLPVRRGKIEFLIGGGDKTGGKWVIKPLKKKEMKPEGLPKVEKKGIYPDLLGIDLRRGRDQRMGRQQKAIIEACIEIAGGHEKALKETFNTKDILSKLNGRGRISKADRNSFHRSLRGLLKKGFIESQKTTKEREVIREFNFTGKVVKFLSVG